MPQLPYSAVILDLDRTLLRTDKSISDYTVNVLRAWKDAGALLFVATARPERAIISYCDMIGFDAVTTLNGARTIVSQCVIECPIRPSSAQSILNQLCHMKGAIISVEASGGIYANKEIPLWNPIVSNQIQEISKEETIYKILVSHPAIPAEQIAFKMPEDTYCTVADQKLLQVMSRSASKWKGIQSMLAAFQISAEKAIYFGDDNDDIEAIRNCGCGVAVLNALDEIKKAADYITESNDEDGVARFLERLTKVLHKNPRDRAGSMTSN